MKILICTGIYPPNVGGPAQYAKEIKEEFERQGHIVKILTYGLEHRLPVLIRHEYFFWRVLFNMRGVDRIIALDTFSVAWPSVAAAKVGRKNIVIRTGGDFLWEAYTERTGDLVMLRDFYQTRKDKLTFKERFIFQVTKWTLQNSNAIAFSTKWQKDIFEHAYELDSTKSHIVENFYGEKLESNTPTEKVFIAGSRGLKLKNLPRLTQAFERAKQKDPSLLLDMNKVSYDEFMSKIKNAYAVILVSLSDISPNMILEAIRYNKPFILTRETGLYDKLKNVGIFVNPESEEEIEQSIIFLSNPENYKKQKEKVASFTFTHLWKEICNELLDISK